MRTTPNTRLAELVQEEMPVRDNWRLYRSGLKAGWGRARAFDNANFLSLNDYRKYPHGDELFFAFWTKLAFFECCLARRGTFSRMISHCGKINGEFSANSVTAVCCVIGLF